MDLNFDRIKTLFESLKHIGFLGRLFGWGQIKNQVIDASGDLQKLIGSIESLKTDNSKLDSSLSVERATSKGYQESNARLTTENEIVRHSEASQVKKIESLQSEVTALLTKNEQFLKRGTELSNELTAVREKLLSAEKDLRELRDENGNLKKDEEFRRTEHSNSVASLKQIQEKLQKDRDKEIHDKNYSEIQRIKNLKETWLTHEENVKNRIKTICSQYTIEYVEKVPFKGKPDNTLKINNEYVIFDAKSPANDDLTNFPNYIKSQVESGKYVKEEDVRREIFLVVPSNTLESLGQFAYKLSDYTVYIISLDSLEPIILALQRIEDYEFAQQLSPEERENICRVIGKFVHLSKRRIQIDGFFAKQFFELVYRSEADLPKELLDKVVEFEKSEKLNPPIERRSKQISIKELEADNDKLKSEANQRGIITQDNLLSKELNKLPLYSTENDDTKNKDQGKLFSQ